MQYPGKKGGGGKFPLCPPLATPLSMIFNLLPLCGCYLGLSKFLLVIVEAPLLSLMDDQIAKINGYLRAVQMTGGLPPTKGEIETASFIFISS